MTGKIYTMKEYLTDGRITLRKYRIGDEFALYEAVCESIDELTRWGFYHPGFTMEDAAEDIISRIKNWDQGKSYTYFIEALPGSRFLGNCAVEEIDFEIGHASLGWWVRSRMTGQGIATAAGRLLAQAAFEDLPFRTLIVYANAKNIASRRVVEKIGAVLLQIKPEDDGRYCAVHELKLERLRV